MNSDLVTLGSCAFWWNQCHISYPVLPHTAKENNLWKPIWKT